MSLRGFSTKSLSRILAVTFVVYLSASLLIIVIPPIPVGKRITRIYKRYISPGPFFTASRITETNLLYISWKSDGKWVAPINPALLNYKSFFSEWNPSKMYKSRLERSICDRILIEIKNDEGLPRDHSLVWSASYFRDSYAAPQADSIRIIVIKSITEKFKKNTDTIQVITF